MWGCARGCVCGLCMLKPATGGCLALPGDAGNEVQMKLMRQVICQLSLIRLPIDLPAVPVRPPLISTDKAEQG